MPFTVTRRTAERRAARRRPRGLAEIQAAQTQYQRDVFGAQERLTGAQTAATREFSELSQQYESQLKNYQLGLDAYNQRADNYSRRVDQYINTINQIEQARSQNIQAMLFNRSVLAQAFGEREYVDVPSAPADPGAFTEQFTMKAPTAPTAPSFQQDIQRFEQESDQARVRMEREVGERRAATMRARRRMTDRPLLSGE